ncbi:MAG: nucleotidyltransferase domain-containing protein [Thermoproteota archaeon]
MSHEIIIEMAMKRREAFDNLKEYLKTIKGVVEKLDDKAELYLFGSVPEKRYAYSSDVDVLVLTTAEPAKVHLELWKAGIREPFEIHVHPPEKAGLFGSKLVKVV